MITIDDYEILEEIGHGAYSTVHIARHIPTNNYTAVKIVDLSRMKKFEFAGIMREVSVYMQVTHKHLTSLYYLTCLENKLYFFIEFASNGTLLSYVNQTKGLDEAETRRIFIQMFDAIRHLHSFHFLVHRDLKLENILLDKNNNAKVTDFGFAGTNYMNVLETFAGTKGYMAPEILSGATYDEKCDVWSLGICLFAMLTGSYPFLPLTTNHKTLIEQVNKFKFPQSFSPGVIDLLKKMLEPRPERRPSLLQLQNHSWLRGLERLQPNFAPIPIVFYEVKEMSQISKFRRARVEPDESVLKMMEEMGYSKDEVKNVLIKGEVGKISGTYFILKNPLHEKPEVHVQKEEVPKAKHVQIPHPKINHAGRSEGKLIQAVKLEARRKVPIAFINNRQNRLSLPVGSPISIHKAPRSKTPSGKRK